MPLALTRTAMVTAAMLAAAAIAVSTVAVAVTAAAVASALARSSKSRTPALISLIFGQVHVAVLHVARFNCTELLPVELGPRSRRWNRCYPALPKNSRYRQVG